MSSHLLSVEGLFMMVDWTVVLRCARRNRKTRTHTASTVRLVNHRTAVSLKLCRSIV